MNAIIEKLHSAEKFINEVLGEEVICRVDCGPHGAPEVIVTRFEDYQRLFRGMQVRRRVFASDSTHYSFTDDTYGVIVKSIDLNVRDYSDSTVIL